MVKYAIPYFHSIQPKPDEKWVKRFLTQPLAEFEKFLQFLHRNNWQTISLDELYDIRQTGISPRQKYCVLTFDDGYVDNYIYVYPLLSKFGFKGTIFISPECVDLRRDVAKNLFDLWDGRVAQEELPLSGYLNWDEICEMQSSGVMDIQSHGMTHTKYYCSDKIVSFHHPGDDCVYQICNEFPELRPYYISMSDFESLLPYGTPFFEMNSSMITKIHWVNRIFLQQAVDLLHEIVAATTYDFNTAMKCVTPLYNAFKKSGALIERIESDVEHEVRIRSEIEDSKRILQDKLNKSVNHLCWPHGANNACLHQIALDSGYLSTSVGKSGATSDGSDRFERIGIGFVGNYFRAKLLHKYKMNSAVGRFPEKHITLALNLMARVTRFKYKLYESSKVSAWLG